jgi:hypothetical protein
MATRKEANCRRSSSKCRVTIDPADPEAGRGGVVPPEATRFRPGRSGNPKGRPAGAETSFERILEQELDRLVEGDPSLGDGGRIPRWRRLVRAQLDATERGDARAARLVLDRIWPATKQEPTQAIELHFDAQDRDA